MFCGFGVLSTLQPYQRHRVWLGIISVASAIFLILKLSQAYTGRIGEFVSASLHKAQTTGYPS
jgi:hypothetical protein